MDGKHSNNMTHADTLHLLVAAELAYTLTNFLLSAFSFTFIFAKLGLKRKL